jgi:hypothetical protein
MNTVDMLMKYEQDDLTTDEIIDLFQHLINTGLIYNMQGHYQRNASKMIQAGLIILPIKGDK